MRKRVFVIVLDSFGIGYEPDAAAFGDVGADTLARIAASPAFDAPHLTALGLGSIDGVNCLPKPVPTSAVLRLREQSMGKDTTVGHFELSGVVMEKPLPTYPQGFPRDLIAAFEKVTGRGVLCNKPYSGTDVIRDFGEEHLKTGKLIVYTSADSVFQIAAHEELVPPEELYEICRKARALLVGEHAVGRVIARPFIGTSAADFKRTANRRDFSLEAPGKTMLDAVSGAGLDVISVGKIFDIFAGRGITESYITHGNAEGMAKARELLDRDFSGLCFINLVDFDMLYGHRQDVDGYAAALSEFDRFLPSFLGGMRKDDLLIITADHGCDPGDDSTDHTREYVPCLVIGEGVAPGNYGTRKTFADLGQTVCDALGVDDRPAAGESFLSLVKG